jgi:hypothetical protein
LSYAKNEDKSSDTSPSPAMTVQGRACNFKLLALIALKSRSFNADDSPSLLLWATLRCAGVSPFSTSIACSSSSLDSRPGHLSKIAVSGALLFRPSSSRSRLTSPCRDSFFRRNDKDRDVPTSTSYSQTIFRCMQRLHEGRLPSHYADM